MKINLDLPVIILPGEATSSNSSSSKKRGGEVIDVDTYVKEIKQKKSKKSIEEERFNFLVQEIASIKTILLKAFDKIDETKNFEFDE
jgi:hypothetical protein